MLERTSIAQGLLRMMVALTVAASAVSCGLQKSDVVIDTPPSVLLITIDTLRADHLGCYGYFRDTSPVIDALASESVVFEHTFAPISTTLPSHVTMLTGVYPHEHGILANVRHGGALFAPAPGLLSLAQGLERAGYRTAAVVSAAPVKRDTGIGAGFQFFREPEGHSRPARETNQIALDWLETLNAGEEFFLWVHFYDPHHPYAPPESFRGLYSVDDGLEEHLSKIGADREMTREGDGFENLGQVVNAYDGEIRFVDQQVGVLLDRLREANRYDDLVIVLAGDHGEGLGQHGEIGHGCIHSEQLRVPWMMKVPALEARRVGQWASLTDLLPTLLGQLPPLGLDDLREQASGADLLSSAPGEEVLFAQRTLRERKNLHPFAYTLIQSRWKLEHEPKGDERLFNLVEDPWELTDLSEQDPDRVARMREELLTRLQNQITRGQALREGSPSVDRPADEKLLEELRALGYVD